VHATVTAVDGTILKVQVAVLACRDEFFFSPAFLTFSPQNALFRHNRFSTIFFSMKMVESGKIVLVSCIIDFKEVQVWLRVFSLNLHAYGVMTEFFKIWPEKIKNSIITPLAWRFKLNNLNQTCTFLKSIMQLTN
jgi:hypothetical protein